MTESVAMQPVTYDRKPLLSGYITEMTQILSGLRPEVDPKQIRKLVTAKVKEAYKENKPTVTIDGVPLAINNMDKYILDDCPTLYKSR